MVQLIVRNREITVEWGALEAYPKSKAIFFNIKFRIVSESAVFRTPGWMAMRPLRDRRLP